MNHKPLALLVALVAGSVHAAANSFADSVPEKAEGVPLAYVGKTTTAATALTLTFKPDGGHDIGALPQGGKVQVLLVDDKGNHLVASEYGIVGWAQARESKDAGDETFPALETVEDKDASASSTTTRNLRKNATNATTSPTKARITPPSPARPSRKKLTKTTTAKPATACSKPRSSQTVRVIALIAVPASKADRTARSCRLAKNCLPTTTASAFPKT